MKTVHCCYHHEDGPVPATALAPQLNHKGGKVVYLPVCPADAAYWYEGADFGPEDYPLVPFQQ